MLNSAIIEVIIGMIFVYSLMAILVTQINTVITNVFNIRAQHLKNAVIELIMDPTTQARFLTHPLICLVKRPLDPNRPMSAQGAERVVASDTADVTWIEPKLFADVLTDIVSAQAGPDRDIYAPLLTVANTVLNNAEKARIRVAVRNVQTTGVGLNDLRIAIMGLADPADRQAMLQALNDVEIATQEYRTDDTDMIAFLRGIRSIQNADFQRALDTIVQSAHNVEQAKARLEKWFDNSMDQVSDKYKRNIQYISLGVGLALALLLNVDTLQLARTLWDDPALRETVAAAARSSLQTGELASQIEVVSPEATPQVVIGAQTAAGADTLTSGIQIETTPEPGPSDEDLAAAQDRLNESVERTQNTVENLLELRLPIGWGLAVVNPELRNPLDPDPQEDTRNLWNFWPPNNPSLWVALWFKKLVGILITTIAVSQGAPFWFDLLNRIAHGGKDH